MFAERLEPSAQGRAQPGLRRPRSGSRANSPPICARMPATVPWPSTAASSMRPRDLAAAYKPQIAFYSALGKEAELAGEHPLHPRARARCAGDPRCQTQRHRQHRRGLCARGLRSLWRRCGHGQSLHGRGFGAAVPGPRPTAAPSCCAAPRIPGARDFQDLLIDGLPLYRRVAEQAAARLERASQPHAGGRRDLPCGDGGSAPRAPGTVVLGARYRRAGRRSGQTLAAGLNAHGTGLLINSSRGIIYAGGGTSDAIRAAAGACARPSIGARWRLAAGRSEDCLKR